MVAVIQPDGEDARRVGEWRMDAYVTYRIGRESNAGIGRGNAGGNHSQSVCVARCAEVDHKVTFFEKGSWTNSAIGEGERYEFHECSKFLRETRKRRLKSSG